MTSLYKDDVVEYKTWNHHYTLDKRKEVGHASSFSHDQMQPADETTQTRTEKRKPCRRSIYYRQYYIILHRRHNHGQRKENNNGTIAYHNTENALLHGAKTSDDACQYSNRPNQRRRGGMHSAVCIQRGTAHPRRRGASGDARIHMKTKSLFTSSCKAKAYLLKPSTTSLTQSLILHDDFVPWSVPSRGGQWGRGKARDPCRGGGEEFRDGRCGRLQPP